MYHFATPKNLESSAALGFHSGSEDYKFAPRY